MRAIEIEPSRNSAGALVHAREPNTWLWVLRSTLVDHPLTWALPGGHVESGEDHLAAAIRETLEETGFDLSGCPSHAIYELRTDWPTGTYRTYAFSVSKPFNPKLNWESADHIWCALSELPSPMHWGVDAMLNDDAAGERLKAWLDRLG